MNLIDTIMHADVLVGLRKIPDSSVSLIVSSPPYNTGIAYATRNDREPYGQFIDWLKDIMIECKRVLRTGGRLIINIDSVINHESDRAEEYSRPIYADLVSIGREIGLHFFTDICWFKHQVVGRATSWGSWQSCSSPSIKRNHEYILIWCKDQYTLQGDSEQSDMTGDEFIEWTRSFWHIKPETRRLNNHPAPFPEELAVRCIKLFSYRNDVVLDMFSGTGTTPYVAKMLGRKYIGIDNDLSHVNFARDRIATLPQIEAEYIPRSKRMEKQSEIRKERERIDPPEDIYGDK